MTNSTPGKFITFEGGEGAGKSTQCFLLKENLESCGMKVILTREPGGTKYAEMIRKILVEGTETIHPKTEALLMFAARCEHWHSLIQPALNQGTWVISDRFVDSSYAYQGYGRGIDLKSLEDLYHFAVGQTLPDLTIFLDLPPKTAFKRLETRKKGYAERFEQEAFSFHERVYEGFSALSQLYPERYTIHDATEKPEDIAHNIFQHVKKHYLI